MAVFGNEFSFGGNSLLSDQLINGIENSFLAIGMGDVCI
jgi:hypothetical protein